MLTVILMIDNFRRSIVNFYEVLHKFQRRQRVIRFCHHILNRKNKTICDVIKEQDCSPLNVGQMHLTEGTFEDSFKSVCNGLFKMRPVHPSYLIAVFAFAMELNEYHLLHSKTWYETDLLTGLLADVLIAYGF